ncbi:MAG: MFS transporter, partial [Mycobacteriaceae bacterium]
HLLTSAIVVWSIAMAASAFATSYGVLLLTRLALGAVIATAAPVVASLVGDFFSASERGRIYGYVLSGELLGAGLGLVVSGSVAGFVSWRASFLVLAVPGMVLAFALHRLLPEPARGGNSLAGERADEGGEEGGDEGGGLAEDAARGQAIAPHRELVLTQDPAAMSMYAAVRYVLSIRTNVVLIAASALAYFFFTGLQTFTVEFLRGRFGLGQSVASVLVVAIGAGSIIGVLLGGRIADRLIGRGVIAGRPLVAGIALLVTAALAAPSLLVSSLVIAAPLLFLAAAAYGATNPPLDAARLDVMHHQLWGRAEAVRTVARSLFTAVAPLTFGYVSTLFGGADGSLGASAGGQGSSAPPGGGGLGQTFLVMLIPVVLGGLLLVLRAVRTYPRDVATVAASKR